jgi:TetR/AcrR family transcriptional repressor of lmrAB and yxaGH operons
MKSSTPKHAARPEDEAAGSTRERLIDAMTSALQRRGLHGVGLTELLEEAGTPKGVLYHHFPGGKTELALAAIERIVQRVSASFTRAAAAKADLVAVLGGWLLTAQEQLAASRFERGCPLGTVALESTSEDEALRRALARGFETVRAHLAAALVTSGLDAGRAQSLAALLFAAYEGALMQARVAGDVRPMQQTADSLLSLLSAELGRASPPRKGRSTRPVRRRARGGR